MSTGEDRYRVSSTQVVDASRVDLLDRTGRSELTLITCFPFDAVVPGGRERFVVHAHADGASQLHEISSRARPNGP